MAFPPVASWLGWVMMLGVLLLSHHASASAAPPLDRFAPTSHSAIRGINYTPRYESWTPESLAPEKYRPAAVRHDLDLIRQMGFNAIRVLPRMTHLPYFDAVLGDLQGNGDVLEDLLRACRERGLKALPVLYTAPLFDDQPAWRPDFTRGPEGERVRRYVEYFIRRLDQRYADVLLGWELANEPDLNAHGRSHEAMAAEYASNPHWPARREALRQLAALTRRAGATRPLSIGYMTAPLHDPESVVFLDVVNYHSYPCLLRDFEREYVLARARAGGRPLLITELAHPGGTHQPASDPIHFCEAHGVGWFLWEFRAGGYWSDTQGLVNADDSLRVAGLPFDLVRRYPRWAPFGMIAYDRTPAGKGNIDQSWAGQYGVIAHQRQDPDALHRMLEITYNVARAIVPYWTADLREVYPSFTAATPMEDRLLPFLDCFDAMRPYVRTNDTAGNDNQLGGRHRIRYREATDSQPVHERLRYAFGRGRESSAALMAVTPQRVLVEGFVPDPARSYRWEAGVCPAAVAPVGLLIGAEASHEHHRPALRVVIGPRPGTETMPRNWTIPQGALVMEITGSGQRLAMVPLAPDDYGADGYLRLGVTFQGEGTVARPLNVIASVNGRERARAACTNLPTAAGGRLGIETLGRGVPMYFDNLCLTNLDEGVMEFSDAFESGAVDWDYVNYDGQKNLTVLANFDRMEALIAQHIAVARRRLQSPAMARLVGHKDGLVELQWRDTSLREAGFVIEARSGNGAWREVWRTWPNQTRCRIPWPGATAGVTFRVRPF